MLGAIAGDVIGSIYERHNHRSTDFPLFHPQSTFTDDTVLSVAFADAILHGGDYTALLKEYYRRYPHAGFGAGFRQWARSSSNEPYYSWGNGSAMRVSPFGWAFDTLDTVLAESERSAAVSHNHPEGIRGAQAVAGCIFLARTGSDRASIRAFVTDTIGYALDDTVENLRVHYQFDVSCPGSVPQSIIAFLESGSYEDCVRKAISIGGDSDTIACMAGGIAEAFYGGVPEAIRAETLARLDEPMRDTVLKFCERYVGVRR